MTDLSPKQKMEIPRQEMPERSVAERVASFSEVNLGLELVVARREAMRCLECANPKCVNGCPVGVKVKEFVGLIVAGDLAGAADKMREDNVLPGVTGRVCPQEDQCEGACVLGKRFQPLGIGYLERFIADWEVTSGHIARCNEIAKTEHRVAVVGSGPAGLTAAGDLVRRGHGVRVFEALHELGGVLTYGIPEFRLPNHVVEREIDNLRRIGVEFETNVVVGRTVTIDELLAVEGYGAVFIATGAGLPRFLDIPGEHFNGIYSANEFLTRVNLMRAYRFPEVDQPVFDCRGKRVGVFGGGNTALDAVRTARRLGAEFAALIYRRSRTEMPARQEEVRHAIAEGIEILELVDPIAFLGDDRWWLRGVRLQRMRLGEPDASGRRRPVPIENSDITLPLDLAVVAIGTGANPLVQATTPDLEASQRGYVHADPETLKTSKPGVFAGGDIVTGSATVILAMEAGRSAARAIDAYLRSGVW